MLTVRTLRSLDIGRRAALQFVIVVALALLAEPGRPCAEDPAPALAVRLSVEVPERSPRDLCVWEELPLRVVLENVGEAHGIPAGERLHTGPQGGAILVVRVRNLAEPTAREADLLLNVDLTSDCNSRVRLLRQGEVARYEGSVSVWVRSILTDTGTVRDVLMAAFPAAGRYSIRVVYTWAGRSAASAPIEIDVHPVPPNSARALAALRDMGRAGLWIYRQSLVWSEPARLASIDHLATAFQGNAYSDLACYTLAWHAFALVQISENADMRKARLREALDYLGRISSPRFSRRDASETMRARIIELLSR